jgi:hypothetical protein
VRDRTPDLPLHRGKHGSTGNPSGTMIDSQRVQISIPLVDRNEWRRDSEYVGLALLTGKPENALPPNSGSYCGCWALGASPYQSPAFGAWDSDASRMQTPWDS